MATLWAHWLVAISAFAMSLFLPRLLAWLNIPKWWLSIPLFIISYGIAVYERSQRNSRGPVSTAVLHVAGLTIFWSALIMMCIHILNSKMFLDGFIDWSKTNRDIPFITCLVMLPVLTVICLWVIGNGYMQSTSDDYRARSGLMPGNGAVATLMSIETRYQVKLLLFSSLALNVVEWWYYFVYYFNTNMNRPDVFFFNWLPIALAIMSLFFMVSRYRNLSAMIGPMASAGRESGFVVRYILIRGDKILLCKNNFDRWDTPAMIHLDKREKHTEETARESLENLIESSDFTLRHLYDTGIPDEAEIFHYAAFIPEDSHITAPADSQWTTLDQIDTIIKSSEMSAEFNDEIFRIVTITLAWKTYRQDGRRIYPIKNYRPTFRISDMKDWTVDYGDINWLEIARFNQDHPFYRINRIWRRLTGQRPRRA